ncbi:MAG: hypothetical protein MI757_18010 [Pirellulales bacterium]|nr:hypothetical protein [Pirellulales bacterium]
MQSTAVNWEDEENNRIISLAVDFTAGDEVELHRLTPTKVTFLCPDKRTQLRSVGVHSKTGRRVLAQAFLSAGKLPELKSRLLEHEPHAVPAQLPALEGASGTTRSMSKA